MVKLVKSRLLVPFAVALLFGGARSAPQPQPAPQEPQAPTFRSGVQLVEVDVRVFDKGGRFVADLTRDDFELVENGAPQKVDAMFLVGAGQPSAPATADATALPPSAPGSSAPAPAAPQTWIFHFDLNHLTPGGGFDRARKAVEDFISARFKDGDLAGILAGDKMLNNRLTSVRQELLDAVKQVKPRSDARTRFVELTREWPRLLNEEEALRIGRGEREPLQFAVTRACGDDPEQCPIAESAVRQKGAKMGAEIQRASLETLSTINGLASGLARVPGPKTVVFLSDGFVAQEVESTLRSVVGQATRAGARFYAIDVRGLNRVGGAGIIDQFQVEDSAGPVTKFDGLADGPNSLAVDTGGLMIRNENNIGRALERVAEDSSRYYVLAYQPSNSIFDGRYRPIQVRVKRDGVRVRARRGYLALPPSRLLIPQPVKSPAERAPEPAAVKEPEPPRGDPAGRPVEPLPAPATGAVVAPPAAPAATGPVTASSAAAPANAVRLRPDSEERVNALSSRDLAGTSDLARSGWEAYQRGDVDSALAAFSKAAAAPGVRPWVLYALGMSQAGLGRGADAIGSWERVRQAAPDFEPVYMDLADTYAQMSDLTRALAVLRDAERRWPKSADVQSAIGVIHVSRGALDEGIAKLAQAAALAPDDPLMHLNLGRAYQMRFIRGRRYVTSQRRWVAPDDDRKKAAEAFQRCIALGGPYAQQAREALNLLEWSKQG